MSDETTRAIIESITVKYPAPTVLPSGHVAQVFYDCVKLTPSDLNRLAAQAIGELNKDSFDMVVGVAFTGVLFAAAIAGGKPVGMLYENRIFGQSVSGKTVLLVDDVIFGGDAIRKAEKTLAAQGAKVFGYACVVDRSNGALASKGQVWAAFRE